MFKFTKSRKFVAMLLAMAVLVSGHLIYDASAMQERRAGTGTDFVAQYLAERGLTHEQAGLQPPPPQSPWLVPATPAAPATPAVTAQPGTAAAVQVAPAAGATAPGGFAAGRGNGGFTPSTRVPHANMAASIRSHAAQAPSVVGWVTIPNTNINFPVNLNRTSPERNNHYLYRTWRGENFTGRLNWRNWNQFPDTATYLDFRTTIGNTWAGTSRNLNLYAHNWTNLRGNLRIGNHPQDRMFAQLKSYTNMQWAAANPHIYFSTPYLEGVWRVFAVGYVHTTPFFFYNNPNPTRNQMETIINEWRARSHIHFSTDVNADDRLLTLTTCTRVHGDMVTQRYVVVARLLRPGESENDVVTATRNPNIRHPNFNLPTRLPTDPEQRAAVFRAQGLTPPATPAPAAGQAPAQGTTPPATLGTPTAPAS